MIWIYTIFLLGTIFGWPKLLKKKSYRELGLQCGLIMIAGLMSCFVEWHVYEMIDPIKPISMMFKPLTKIIYQIL